MRVDSCAATGLPVWLEFGEEQLLPVRETGDALIMGGSPHQQKARRAGPGCQLQVERYLATIQCAVPGAPIPPANTAHSVVFRLPRQLPLKSSELRPRAAPSEWHG